MKSWKIALIVVGLFVVIGAGYYAYNRIAAAATKKQTTTQPVAVQKGTISQTVSAQGATSFPNIVDLYFGTAGTVSKLRVKQGDSVKKGQALAELDIQSISNLRRVVAQAKVNLDNAQNNLRDTKSATSSAVDVALAEAAVAKARQDVKIAQDNLDAARAPEGVAKVNAAVKTAQSALDDSRRALDSSKTIWGLKLQTDQQSLYGCPATPTKCSGAEDNYRKVFKKYLGMQLTDAQIKRDPKAIMKDININLEVLFVKDSGYSDYLFYTRSQDVLQAIAAKAPSGVDPMVVYGNLYLLPQLPSIDDILTEFDNVWNALVTARNQYATDLSQSALDISNAEKNIVTSEDNLRQAKKNADNVSGGVADPVAVTVMQKQLDVARAQLALAEENLANKSKSPDPLIVALREAEVASAQATLDDALQKLDNATIKAPFDGYVTNVPTSEGKLIIASATVVSMIDPSVVEVNLTVDEVDIAQVRLNQPASISLDALGGIRLIGTVTAITPVGKQQSGVVSYPVVISLQRGGTAQAGQFNQSSLTGGSAQTRQGGQNAGARTGNRATLSPSQAADIQLSMGMTATADIIVQRKEGVLLVPSRAIKTSQQGSYVEVVVNGNSKQVFVKTGITDGTRTEIADGLQEGELVVVPQSSTQTNLRTPGLGGFGGPPPGGFAAPIGGR